jgi:hypothetical protein
MSQYDFGTIDPNTKSGTALATDLNSWRNALHSTHGGSSAPSYITAGMLWADTTSANYELKMYDGAQSITVAVIDATNNVARVAVDSAETSYITSTTAGQIQHIISGSAMVTVNSTGVGIGTSSPTSLGTGITTLELKGNSASQTDRAGGINFMRYDGNPGMYVYHSDDASYISSLSTYPLLIETNGAERMRINSAGNVGIGLTPSTSAPLTNVSAGLLQVNGNVELRYEGANVDPSGARYFNIVNTDTTLVADQPLGGIQWVGLDTDNPNSNMASITSYCSGNTGTTGDLRFKIAGTERARIDSSGNLLVATTATDPISSNVGGISLGSDNIIRAMCSGGPAGVLGRKTSTGDIVRFYYNGPTQVGSISTNGTSTAYNTSSDYRLKENVQPMQDALAVIAQLNPVTYTWKADGSDGQGFIAHELQAVVPDCVSGEKDAVDAEGNPQYQGVDTSFLVATLVKAVQELTARIAALEAAQ